VANTQIGGSSLQSCFWFTILVANMAVNTNMDLIYIMYGVSVVPTIFLFSAHACTGSQFITVAWVNLEEYAYISIMGLV